MTREEPKGSYIYVAPVSGVMLGNAVNEEYRIDRATLFSKDKFLRLRRYRLQFSSSRIRKATERWIEKARTVAVLEISGRPADLRQECHLCLKDELNLLASARLGFSKRTRRTIIGLAGSADQYDTDDVFIGRDADLMSTRNARITSDFLIIHRDFVRVQPDRFFPRLLMVVRSDSGEDPEWKKLLRSVAVLAGKSQNSVEAADAFLWNMIALEQLLLTRKERSRHLDLLLLRMKAFFGYCPCWKVAKIDEIIRKLYLLRCQLVHEGQREKVALHHVISSDTLLMNILTALMQNSRLFPSKISVLEFAEKARARNLLGMPAKPAGWKFSYSQIRYEKSDVEKHWRL